MGNKRLKITIQILLNKVGVNNKEEKALVILIVIKANRVSIRILLSKVSERHDRDSHK